MEWIYQQPQILQGVAQTWGKRKFAIFHSGAQDAHLQS